MPGEAAPPEAAGALAPPERERARRLTLWYLAASTAIFFVSGLLGVLLRDSQADLGRLDDSLFYAIMTAHGLGAFVGWAAFAVMGLSFWVFASVGFPVRRFGAAMAWTAFWTMVLGVLGVVVTTLILDFGASWVFLYPLPFFSSGQWSEWVTALFSASILVVGVSIITWCLAVLHTVVGPALHAVRPSIANRFGVALGFGYLWPRRFATNPTPVPYAVIPLTVIGASMLVATLPLAALLVVMIVQAAAPSVTVDPLLAKNLLWFFGHPVVYLLLFPAAAVYYLLIPRYAGRPLVAGNVVAVSWVIAVIGNVIVWAHHIYLDYPEGTPQAALNVAMQPTTFALALPSALSLYSLAFTVYRSSFRWTAASTALFLGLVGWLLSGLSGIVNATIAFDEVVHNTLWVVGHFHHMAFLNVGLLIFGATYAFLPELTGKRLRSEVLAKWHVWVTFLAGAGFVAVWLIQGLQGAPRRFSVLPGAYDDLTIAAIPFVFVLALAQLLFGVNVVQTLRGAGGCVGEPERVRPARPRREKLSLTAVETIYVLISLALALAAGAAGWAIGHAGRPAPAPPVTVTQPPAETVPPPTAETGTQAPAADPAKGAQVFAQAGCGSCHVLAAAGASGTVGPSLDQRKPTADLVVTIVTDGRGAMPPFKDQLSQEQIEDVAAFVAQSTAG